MHEHASLHMNQKTYRRCLVAVCNVHEVEFQGQVAQHGTLECMLVECLSGVLEGISRQVTTAEPQDLHSTVIGPPVIDIAWQEYGSRLGQRGCSKRANTQLQHKVINL